MKVKAFTLSFFAMLFMTLHSVNAQETTTKEVMIPSEALKAAKQNTLVIVENGKKQIYSWNVDKPEAATKAIEKYELTSEFDKKETGAYKLKVEEVDGELRVARTADGPASVEKVSSKQCAKSCAKKCSKAQKKECSKKDI